MYFLDKMFNQKKIVQDETDIGGFPLIGGKGSCLNLLELKRFFFIHAIQTS